MYIYIILLTILFFTLWFFGFSLFNSIFKISFIFYSIDLHIIVLCLICLLSIVILFKTYKYLWKTKYNKILIIILPVVFSFILFFITNYISLNSVKKYQKETVKNYEEYIKNEVLIKYEDDNYIIMFDYENEKETSFILRGNNTDINIVFEKNTYNIISENYYYG